MSNSKPYSCDCCESSHMEDKQGVFSPVLIEKDAQDLMNLQGSVSLDVDQGWTKYSARAPKMELDSNKQDPGRFKVMGTQTKKGSKDEWSGRQPVDGNLP